MILGERDFPIFEQNKSGKGMPLPTDDLVNDVTPLPKRVQDWLASLVLKLTKPPKEMGKDKLSFVLPLLVLGLAEDA